MNRCWAEKLVETTAGGGAAKGARLTACGRKVLDAYRALERQLADTAVRGNLDTLTALLRDAPRPPGAPAAPPSATAGDELADQSRLPQAFEGKAKRGSVTKR
jgi:molybdenum-dependent DNA-binding transcriptional regulator ModE